MGSIAQIINNVAIINPVDRLTGTITVCPDKSITHRAVILAGLSEGISEISNYLSSEDCLRTVTILTQLGAEIQRTENKLVVKGIAGNFIVPKDKLYAGNSGTTIRLISGILAGLPFPTEIYGDESLTRRPMKRVITPLQMMGAHISARDNEYPPLQITGTFPLKPITYRTLVASAQVKSAILLAGLFADGETQVDEPFLSRDHTERMFVYFGIPFTQNGTHHNVRGPVRFTGKNIEIVGDISAASFFLVAGLIVPNAQIYLRQVGVNPTRTGIIDVLKSMGGKIDLLNPGILGCEPVADIKVEYSKLNGVTINNPGLIPRLIDEIPVLGLAATQAEGDTVISGATELKHKESNRIETVATTLTQLGAKIKVLPDGMVISGKTSLTGTEVDSFGDHRVAMTMAIAGLIAKQGLVTVKNVECINTSFPDFWTTLNNLT